ncbi:cell division protein ZipA [Parahaliea maris]|uniref:Cell division protein ZipA n=1 Tax=Parahaliea maris TaxID=2716870 RepID=A0A5C9A6F5_9GAMM|nr:cell division protein ZipA [Parahaliea maris]TXS95592.1 cell division protein ZipA [Parahaliea maris]
MADLTIRDWMVIIGALLILAVLADAWRRIYQDRRAPVRMKLATAGDSGDSEGGERRERDIDLAWLKELPNGGARVVDRGADDEYEDAYENDFDERPEPAPARVAKAEAAEVKAAVAKEAAQQTEQERSAQPAEPAQPVPRDTVVEKPAPASRKPAPPPVEDEVELLTGMSSSDEPENLDWLDALEAESKPEPQVSQARAHLPRDIDPEVFMLNVVARDPQGFRGDDIMQILLACGLRFGDMNFFHRHEHDTGRGPIQFSVANMLQPGVFDIDNMADFTTQGLVFFVTLPGPDDMMKAYDYMLETAQAVARNLKGDVLDETRSVLTRQTLEHARQQIRDLERRLLAKAR